MDFWFQFPKLFDSPHPLKLLLCLTHGRIFFHSNVFIIHDLQLITSHYHILNHQHWLLSKYFFTSSDLFGTRVSKKFLNPQHLCINWSISVEYIFCAPCTRLDFFFSQHAFPSHRISHSFFQFSSRLMLFAAFYVPPLVKQCSTAQERRTRREKLLEMVIKRSYRDLCWCGNVLFSLP